MFICLKKIVIDKEFASLSPYAFPGYYMGRFVWTSWFNVALFSIELCVAFPIDFVLHFPKKPQHKIYVCFLLNCCAAYSYNRWFLQWGQSIQNKCCERYFEWRGWAASYCLGSVGMCIKLLLQYYTA